MTANGPLRRLGRNERLNFLLTNRIPRRGLTLFVGWLSRVQRPWVSRMCIALWAMFTDLELADAKQRQFRSMHDCFTRELKEGSRPIDPDPALLTSPCDAVVGACGPIEDGLVLQAKGSPYRLAELLMDPGLARRYRDGVYATLRLTSGMYHRFHAPHDCRVEHIDYLAGDTWNVNPTALARIERLFCRNERAVIRCRLAGGDLITLVPVASILVASIRLKFLDVRLHLRYRGPNAIDCDVPLRKGEEMGWFEHGSTIIVLAPGRFALAPQVRSGVRIRMGRPLFAPRGATAVADAG